jgi:hypothetical protein
VSTDVQLILGFASTILAGLGFSFYPWYTRSKDYVIIDIQNVLEDCRALSSWDDCRSELKLPSWIGGDERDLHRRSLWALRRIRRDMWRYYQIHAEMRDGVPYGTYQDSGRGGVRGGGGL